MCCRQANHLAIRRFSFSSKEAIGERWCRWLVVCTGDCGVLGSNLRLCGRRNASLAQIDVCAVSFDWISADEPAQT